jgi:hypothetical protein
MRRITLLALLLTLGCPTWATSPESILGPDPDLAGAQNAQASPQVDAIPELNLKMARKKKAFLLLVEGGPSVRNYTLTSSALNASFPGAFGYEVALSFERELSETERLSGSFSTFSHTFSGVTSITPSTFAAAAWNTFAQYSFVLAGDTESTSGGVWWMSLGYEMKKRTGANGSPVTPLDTVWYHGPRVGFIYERPKKWGSFGYQFSTHVMIPWFFQEDIQTTGSFKYGISSDNTLSLRYELRDTATLMVGVKFYLDFRSYFGTGTRGSTNATELETVFSFPLSCQIRF